MGRPRIRGDRHRDQERNCQEDFRGYWSDSAQDQGHRSGTLDAIIQTLVSEGRIELRNFGVFEVKQRAPRKARNPRTGDKVYVPSKNVVTFKPGKEMEELVRKIDPSKLPLLEEELDADLDNDGIVEPVSEPRTTSSPD